MTFIVFCLIVYFLLFFIIDGKCSSTFKELFVQLSQFLPFLQIYSWSLFPISFLFFFFSFSALGGPGDLYKCSGGAELFGRYLRWIKVLFCDLFWSHEVWYFDKKVKRRRVLFMKTGHRPNMSEVFLISIIHYLSERLTMEMCQSLSFYY